MFFVSVISFLVLLPICIFLVVRRGYRAKKRNFIISEILAILLLAVVSTVIVLDIPYIKQGGVIDEDVTYIASDSIKMFSGSTAETRAGDKYWMADSIISYLNSRYINLTTQDNIDYDIYVLPHTRTVYRIETSVTISGNTMTSEIYNVNNGLFAFFVFMLVGIEIILVLLLIFKKV